MKLIYLHQHFTTPRGRSGTRSYEVAKRMLAKGHDVTVICGSFGAGETGLTSPFDRGCREGVVDRIKVIELELPYDNKHGLMARSIVFMKFAYRTIRLLHRIKGVDLIYATSTPLTVAVPALWARLMLRIPYIFEVRDLWPELPRAMKVITNPLILAALGALEWLAYRFSVACVGLSPGMVRGILRRSPNARVELIPNGCDSYFFNCGLGGQSRQDARASAAMLLPGFDPAKRNIVFAGTFGLANDLAQVILAVQELPDLSDRVVVHLVGDGAQREYLATLIEERGLQSAIKLHFSISKDHLSQILSAFDGGLMILKPVPAFYYGTSPNKFFDYVAARLPVICNHPGWVSDLLEEHGAGFSADGTIDGLAQTLRDFCDASDLMLDRMRLGAGRLAVKYDRDALVDRQISLCESAVARSKPT